MLPAFRVKGLRPGSPVSSSLGRNHPLTGARLPLFQNTEAILQLPRDKYNELVSDHPEYRLRYLDEDKDEITIGSEVELTNRLDESTSHSHFIKRSEDPKFYTSMPECMHLFHLDDNEEARKVWSFLASATLSRNQGAHKLWTSPRVESTLDIQDLLNQHAYEFMTGYNFEGFNSHYNYLSESGRQIKDIVSQRGQIVATGAACSKADSRPSETVNVNQSREPTPVNSPPESSEHSIKSSANDLAGSHASTTLPVPLEDVSAKLLEIHMDLDRQLKDAQVTTDMLDKLSTASSSNEQVSKLAESVKIQLDKQLTAAKDLTASLTQGCPVPSFTKLTLPPSIEKAESKESYVSKEEAVQVATSFATPLAPTFSGRYSQPGTVGFAKYASQQASPTSRHLSDAEKWIIRQTGPTEGILTDSGKQASMMAGVRLHQRLNSIPKSHAGVSTDEIQRWMIQASDPPVLTDKATGTQNLSQADATSLDDETFNSKKKLVRFSVPSFSRGQWNLDGSFIPGSVSETKGTDTSTTPVIAAITPSQDETRQATKLASLTHATNDPFPSVLKRLSSTDISKLQELLRAFDNHDAQSTVSVEQQYKMNLLNQGLPSKLPEPNKSIPSAIGPNTEPAKASKKATINSQLKSSSSNSDSVETTVTKLCCQALEGITSCIQTLAQQLEIHVQPQIDREQADLDKELRECVSSTPVGEDATFFEGIQHVKDLIELRKNVKNMTDNLRKWTETNMEVLEAPVILPNHAINTRKVDVVVGGLGSLRDHLSEGLRACNSSCVVVDGYKHKNGSTTWDDSNKTAWVPRRYRAQPQLVSQSANRNQLPVVRAALEITQSMPTRNEQATQSMKMRQKQAKTKSTNVKRQLLESFPPLIPSKPHQLAPQRSVPSLSMAKPMTFPAPPGRHRQENNMITTKPSLSLDTLGASQQLHRASTGDLHSRWSTIKQISEQGSSTVEPSGRHPSFQKDSGLNRDSLPGKHQRRTAENEKSIPKGIPSEGDQTAEREPQRLEQRNSGMLQGMTGLDRLQVLKRQAEQHQEAVQRYNNAMTAQACKNGPLLKPGRSGPPQQQTHSLLDNSPWAPTIRLAPQAATRPFKDNLYNVSESFEDIPEHTDAKTADMVVKCVEILRTLGYASRVKGGDARLVVYAQAAKGDLEAAIDIIAEEQQVYKEQQDLSKML